MRVLLWWQEPWLRVERMMRTSDPDTACECRGVGWRLVVYPERDPETNPDTLWWWELRIDGTRQASGAAGAAHAAIREAMREYFPEEE